MERVWSYDKETKKVYLEPCPFCGNDFVDGSYDRGTKFSCETCGYSRIFKGLLQTEISKVLVPYIDKDGNKVPLSEVKNQEYYHQFAKIDAIVEMNKRVSK